MKKVPMKSMKPAPPKGKLTPAQAARIRAKVVGKTKPVDDLDEDGY